jgi:hypothetical protein
MMYSIVRLKKIVARMVATMEVRHKKLHPSIQMTRECQGLPKTKERNLKQGHH